MELGQIYFGKSDAKNEVLTNSPEELERFTAAFVEPPALSVKKFQDREKYFIVGPKGTGKTALLRYVSAKLDKEEDGHSSFILFKSEIDEDLKKEFAKAARVQVTQENSDDFAGEDFEQVWRWFTYRKIAAAVVDNPIEPFQKTADLNSFIAIVNSEDFGNQEPSGIFKLIPKIRKGKIEISKSPMLGLEFDWDDSGKAKVDFGYLVRQADTAFEKLIPNTSRLNIFFDELELNYGTSKQHTRDSWLVRDLIVTVEKINATCKKKGFPICLYAAIRSEVLNSVDSLGKEINKPLFDFGSIIKWNSPNVGDNEQPLLEIVVRRINNARTASGLTELIASEIWETYFPDLILGKYAAQEFILHNSWYRPRDIVRLLSTAQEQYPRENSFRRQTIENVRRQFSQDSWVEMTEELKANYKPSEISGIKNILYGFKRRFNLGDLTVHAAQVAENYADTAKLLEKHQIKIIASDLYRVGILGNISEDGKHRFSFRGDENILYGQMLFLHIALRPTLSL